MFENNSGFWDQGSQNDGDNIPKRSNLVYDSRGTNWHTPPKFGYVTWTSKMKKFFQLPKALPTNRSHVIENSAALVIPSGLIPIYRQMKYEAAYGTLSRLRIIQNKHGAKTHHTGYAKKSTFGEKNSRIVEPRNEHSVQDIVIYNRYIENWISSNGLDLFSVQERT